ncbi:segregation and condensation protein A [Stratiformator vulcanicus]|uniref:Segregation and condensation protein A n=1 Tax=Stratiformator vulcanicus TaxID=2527980 RepID=A0A517R270_9PLAN|nr:segregation/condensation protein A [Stratiformator vulcanicus]QDT37979.1 Segregation and condensation protein A [Stratiformator vulcanicus]
MSDPDLQSPFSIDLREYCGPLDLLLHLVRRSEVDLREMRLAELMGQYVAYVDLVRTIDVDLAGDFVQAAGTLLEVKSRVVLPGDEVEQDEETLLDPAGSEIVERLLEYARFREAGQKLASQAQTWRERYPRLDSGRPGVGKDPTADRIKEVELWDLVSAYSRMTRPAEAESGSTAMAKDDTPVSVLVEQLAEQARRDGSVRFSECIRDRQDRGRVVGVFLAILELLRHHQFRAVQTGDHGDIEVTPPDTPTDTPTPTLSIADVGNDDA